MKKYIYFLFLIILIDSVFAIAMSSPSFNANFDFEPNLNITRNYYVSSINIVTDEFDPKEELSLTTSMDAGPQDLTQYVVVEPESVFGKGSFKWTLKLPASLEAGFYSMQVCCFEKPKGEGMISSSAGICDLIGLRVLYEGKVLEYGFSATNVDLADESVEFKLSVVNNGKDEIENVKGFIDIYDIDDRKISVLETNSTNLVGGARAILNGYLLTKDILAGKYWAEARIIWDGNENQTKTNFTIGSALLKITDITTEYLVDEINPINLTVRNGFKGGVEGAYVVLKMPGREIKLPTFNMKAFEEKEMTTYWDTEGLEEGTYNIEATLFGGETYTQDFDFELKGKKSNLKIYVGIVFILLVIAAIVLVVFLRRKKYEEEV